MCIKAIFIILEDKLTQGLNPIQRLREVKPPKLGIVLG